MKFLIIFIFSTLFGLEIVVDTTNNYSILTMTNDKPFACKTKQKNTFICKFNSLPTTPVFSTNTLDFNITPFFGKTDFYLQIKVKNKSFIKSFKKNLYEGYNKRLKPLKIAKKWVIISYKNKLPFLTQKPIKGLKFPLKIETDFYLKAVDINGNPIDFDTQTADVREYFSILKLFNKHTLTMDRVDEFLQNYPNSIFTPDVLYIKLKLLDEENQYDEIIKIANDWLKKYSFNEHLPQVLLILAKAYGGNGQTEEATYIYERLFTEYQDTKYAYEGMIYLADELYSAGDSKRAYQLYKEAFTKTKNIEVASLAASKLAQRYLEDGNLKEARIYYEKLLKSNKQFLLKDLNKAYKLALQLAKSELYDIAIQIGEAILNKITKDSDIYEPLIYNLAMWAYHNNDFKLSLKYINEYLIKFPYGEYSDQLNDLKDKVVFEIPDKNITAMIKKYDEIIQKYPDTDLAQKALYKKAMLLYQNKKYEQFLELKVDTNKTMIINSAKNIVIQNLKTKKCFKAIKYYKEYNITLPKKYDDYLFECAFKTKNFNIASQVCNKYLLGDDKTALKWLKNKAKVFEATHNYEKLALIIDDICNLQKTNCYEWKYKQFFAYYNLNQPQQFLKIAASLPENIKNLDIFNKVVLYGLKQKNNLLVYTYSKKIINLQKKYNTFILSPNIDFIFVEVAKKLNKTQEAIQDLKNVLKLNLNDNDKARVYYLLASLTSNKIYLQKCIKLQKSTWQSLCKDSLEVLNE